MMKYVLKVCCVRLGVCCHQREFGQSLGYESFLLDLCRSCWEGKRSSSLFLELF